MRQNHIQKPKVRPKPRYGPSIGSGMEASVKPLLDNPRRVHKVFSLDWISKNYSMGGHLRWISREAFSITDVPIKDVQPRRRARRGIHTIPASQWERLTFLLATHSKNVISAAKKLKIPVPEVFKPVAVEGKSGHFWVIEQTNLEKEGAVVIPASNVDNFPFDSGAIKNEIITQLWKDKRKLEQAGYFEDPRHRQFGGWMLRIDKLGNKWERFLVDGSNFKFVPKE